MKDLSYLFPEKKKKNVSMREQNFLSIYLGEKFLYKLYIV